MSEQNVPTTDPAEDLPEQMRVRRAKRDRLLAGGRPPYPVTLPRTDTLAGIRARYFDLPTDTASGDQVSITGRVIFIRTGGKLCFATLRDGDGAELQAMLSLDRVGAEALEEWKRTVDLGDLVGVTGEVITSRRGELSVLAASWAMSAKALRPLPVAHKPMTEEGRVRQRYVDLIVRPQSRDVVRTRATVVRSLRESLFRRNYLEVETPMLQLLHGGAAARPFVTHSNALDMDLYLRIAPELFLKRAVVGGIERVFEINRNFRNEGMDSSHSPEFAMREAYQAYADYNEMRTQVREWIQEAATAVAGSHVVTHYDGTELDLGGEWAQITLFGSLSEALGEEVTVRTDLADLQRYADKHNLPAGPKWSAGKLAEELFEHLVQPSPLTRAHRQTPGLAEKWDLYVRGCELGTAYIPSWSTRMGIDRLLMALTGLGIRETILFPLVRPE